MQCHDISILKVSILTYVGVGSLFVTVGSKQSLKYTAPGKGLRLSCVEIIEEKCLKK